MNQEFLTHFPFRHFVTALAAATIFAGPLHAQITLAMDDKGIAVKNNNLPVTTVEYPLLVNSNAVELHKIVGATSTSDGAIVTYEGGASCKISINSATIDYSFSAVPSDTTSWRTQALLDFDNYQKGGMWKIDSGTATLFPANFAGNEKIFSDHGTSLQLTDGGGSNVIFQMPPYAYVELSDNRKWNWNIYDWHMSVPFTPDTKDFSLMVSAGGASSASAVPATNPAP